MKHLNEFKDYKMDLDERELLEMANLTSEQTGIDNVVIWVGPNPSSHGKRIKVSNVANSFSGTDCFTMTIPEFKVIGNVNKSLITTKVLEKIKDWTTKNLDVIEEYSEEKMSTADLIHKIVK